jgi:subtilisin family serine protease
MKASDPTISKRATRRRIQRAVLTLAILGLTAANGLAQVQNFILRTADIADVSDAYGLLVIRQLGASDNYLVSGPGSVLPNDLISEVSADSRVLDFELDYNARHPEAKPNPPSSTTASSAPLTSALSSLSAVKFNGDLVWNAYANQLALQQIGASGTSGAGVIVAVIDTGVDPAHPALARWLVPGYDFIRNTSGIPNELADLSQYTAALLGQSTAAVLGQSTAAMLGQSTAVVLNQSTVAVLDQSTAAVLGSDQTVGSEFGHGTMVAGLIHLVAPSAKIMPLKAFTPNGVANVSDIINAIYYAVNNGARIINMSFSQDQISTEVMRAINYANRNGVICVASTGNQNQSTLVYPAGYGNVLGVASVSPTGTLSTFSNYGPDITTVAAPGEGLITTYPGAHYAAAWGTSFSSALVSGAVANIVNACSTLSESKALNSFAANQTYTNQLGYGLINLSNALWAAAKTKGVACK